MKRSAAVIAGTIVMAAVVVSMAVRLEREVPAVPIGLSTGEAVADSSPANGAAVDPTKGDAARIAMADFISLQADRRVLVVDVRVEGTFREGHIPGAINVGADAVGERAPEILTLAAGRPIVTYCSCVNEHSSAVAAVRLTEAGAADVRALVGGYPAWVAQGGPVAKGDGSGE